jgi:hypothetical protein
LVYYPQCQHLWQESRGSRVNVAMQKKDGVCDDHNRVRAV